MRTDLALTDGMQPMPMDAWPVLPGEQAWRRRVEAEGLRCQLCGMPPSQRESLVFLRTGCCAYCAYHPLVRSSVLGPARPLRGGFPK